MPQLLRPGVLTRSLTACRCRTCFCVRREDLCHNDNDGGAHNLDSAKRSGRTRADQVFVSAAHKQPGLIRFGKALTFLRATPPQAQVADIGLMGCPAKKDGKAVEGVRIFLGGSIGENAALASEFEKVGRAT